MATSDLTPVWANRAATLLFDVPDYNGLRKRFSARGSMMARTLAHLAHALAPGAAPRLVRLRFAWGTRVQTLTALCGRAQDIGGPSIMLLAFVGLEAETAGRGASWSSEADGDPTPLPTMSIVAPSRAVEGAEAPEATAVNGGLAAIKEALLIGLGGRDICRFAWQTDALGGLRAIDRSVMETLGLALSADSDLSLVAQIAAFDPTTAVEIAAAMAGRTTWGGLSALCPVLEGNATLPMGFAASPQFDAARDFQGFRGFCRFDLAQLRRRDRSEPDGPELSMPVAIQAEMPPPTLVLDTEVLSPDEIAATSPAALPSASPTEATPPPFDGDRSANVVQLWPVHAPPLGRAPYQAMRAVSPDGAGAFSPRTAETDPSDGDLRSRIEAAVGQSLDSKSGLSTSEHQAFKAIGRALGPGPRRAASPIETPPPVSVTTAPLGRDGGSEFLCHAASLVETTSAGLVVMRNRRVLFANEAVREALHFDNHADLLDALTLHFALTPPPEGTPTDGVLILPSSEGEERAFGASAQSIALNDTPAILWTLVVMPAAAGQTAATPVIADATVAPLHGRAADFTAVLDVSGEAIAVIDTDGRLLRINVQAERYFGRDRGALSAEPFTELLASESRAAAAALFAQVKADPGTRPQARGECVGRSASGASLPLEIRLARLDDASFAVIWRDLAAQRGLERELVQARRQAARVGDQQPEFLANVSHQIRSPLNAILGFAEIMIDERFGPLGNPRYKDYLKDMHASGTQVIVMIDDLMDLSRIESGRLDLRLGAIDINKVIADCVADAHALAHRERIIVRTSFGARLPPVMADERSARQIIGNLLSNAIKFNEPGGQVIVSTASSDDARVVVRIRDTGIGMSDDDIASALEPFRQLAPTKNASGTGLGLPLTKALVGANGAALSMRSRLNEGTMVEVTFQATVPTPTRVPA